MGFRSPAVEKWIPWKRLRNLRLKLTNFWLDLVSYCSSFCTIWPGLRRIGILTAPRKLVVTSQKASQHYIHSLLWLRFRIKKELWSFPSAWQTGDSLTRSPKDPIAVSWLKQLDEYGNNINSVSLSRFPNGSSPKSRPLARLPDRPAKLRVPSPSHFPGSGGLPDRSI